ncbi:DUF4124 domain-containing protein [Variovorax paradoxus]|uniref:DUF4124 domain-containing protein n=1 Tax=Variovorax paradoxus TaxID=34073 RepID=UPI0019314E62|nr:DUF4124 domain-containing protein [Variovorax paradoxus]
MPHRIAIAALFICMASGAAAQVHRCVDAAGKTSFSDQPCPTGSKSAVRVLGANATDRRWENEVYGRERNMRSIENASRSIQEPTSDGMVGGPAMMGAPTQRGQLEPMHPPSVAVDAEGCDTVSPRRGCYGGERNRNPNWSARRGYYGGGGPADQQYEREQQERAASAPGPLVGCDASGCWGSQNGVRYNRVAGGNLQGTDGRFCVRGAGNTFSC